MYPCVPVEIEVRSENQAPDENLHGVASLDPGVRTFQTIYDADGKMIKWGRGNMSKLFRILGGVDDIHRKLHDTNQNKITVKRFEEDVAK